MFPWEEPYCGPMRERICPTTRSGIESLRIDPLGSLRCAKILQFTRGKLSLVHDKSPYISNYPSFIVSRKSNGYI